MQKNPSNHSDGSVCCIEFTKKGEIEMYPAKESVIPILLKVLADHSGGLTLESIIEKVAEQFAEMTGEERQSEKWRNLIHWSMDKAPEEGWLSPPPEFIEAIGKIDWEQC